jgi:transcriptional regulator with XRE-family HTH domain
MVKSVSGNSTNPQYFKGGYPMPEAIERNSLDYEGNDIDLQIGRRVRSLRRKAPMTLDALAQHTGLSKALLSKIENGKVSSPISTYAKIARSLGVSLSELLKEAEEIRFLLVRKEERKPQSGRKTPYGYSFESLGARWPNKSWSPFLMTYNPLPEPHTSPGFNYDGEEFLYVLEGRLEFFCGERRFELEPGDCLFVDGSLPHGGRAIGSQRCTAILVVAPRNS